MDQLITRVENLNRRIYASFSWGYRVAGLMLHLASDLMDTLGRLIYAEFIKSGVQEMPDVGGSPAESFKDKLKGPMGPNRLPKGYGKEFGRRLYVALLSKAKNPDVVEEVLSRLMLNIARGVFKLDSNYTLKKAEYYVMQSAFNLLKDLWREQKSQDKLNAPMVVDEEGEPIDISDPDSFKNLDQMLPRSDLESLLRDLKKVDQRAPSWLGAKLEGLRDTEIADEWKVSKPYVSMWQTKHLPGIKRVIMDYIRAAA